MRYLVTGGLGVIGSHIARKLLAAGHDVTIIDSAEEKRNRWISDGLFVHQLTAPGRLIVVEQRLERGVDTSVMDAVIHCAASTGIPYSVNEPSDDWERHVEGTRVLLDELRKHSKPTVVLSSVKPYHVSSGLNEGRGLSELDVLEPDEPYAASKAAQSMLCQAYAKSYGIPVVTFRCSNLYGPAPCHGPRHGWLTWFCISAAIGRTIHIQGTGEQSRDMLHADDVYSACIAALENADALKGEIFNLGGGKDNRISVKEAAEYMQNNAGAHVMYAPARAMDDLHVFACTSKFYTAVGWQPKVGVADGMKNVLDWAKENADELKKLYEGV